VSETLDILARRFRLAVVSNIDDDLLAATRLNRNFDLVCTAERASGYKPDGTLFRYLIEHAGVRLNEIFHAVQSQFTAIVRRKPLVSRSRRLPRRGPLLAFPLPCRVFFTRTRGLSVQSFASLN